MGQHSGKERPAPTPAATTPTNDRTSSPRKLQAIWALHVKKHSAAGLSFNRDYVKNVPGATLTNNMDAEKIPKKKRKLHSNDKPVELVDDEGVVEEIE